MNPEAMNISLNELSHHGVLGMKWGIRRFQKYPAGYSGDGKYVGPDGQPRQPTRKEARRDRKYNELKTKIDKWLVDSVNSGDKKTLKRLKKTMTPQQYQSAYDALVKKGISDAVKTGDKTQLKKYKDDVSKNEYKDAKTLADFNDAVNKLDTERMNKLVGKIKNEDIKESAQRIAAITELQNKKVGALKVESEAAAKLAKVANTAATVAKLATSAKTVYDAVSGAKKSYQDRQYELEKRAKEINKENEKEAIEKIINSGNTKLFEKNKDKFTNQQVKDFYERQYLKNKDEIDRAILTGDSATKIKNADKVGYAPVETLNKATDSDLKYKAPTWDSKIQNELKKARDESYEVIPKLQAETSNLYQKAKDGDKDVSERYKRASVAEKAATILYEKNNMDYKAYAANDPTGQTWGDVLKKKSADIGKTVSELKLTPAAKKAQRDAEEAVKKAQDIQVNAAKKVMDLYNKNPEAFLSGEQTFVNPFPKATALIDDLLNK